MESTDFLARQPAYRIAVSCLPSQKYWLRALELTTMYLSNSATMRLQDALLTWAPEDMPFVLHLVRRYGVDGVSAEIIGRLEDAAQGGDGRWLLWMNLECATDNYPGHYNWAELIDQAIGHTAPSLLSTFSR